MPTSLRSIVWIVAVLALAAGQTASSRQFALPRDAGEALDNRWDTWSLAAIAPEAAACAADAGPAVTLDIDGDGLMDVAAAVRAPDGVHLVALLQRQGGHELYEIHRLGDDLASGYVTVTAPGTAYRNPRNGQETWTLAPTITILRCGQETADLYEWLGFRFNRITVPRAPGRPD